MTGFETRIYGIESDRSANWATTNAQIENFSLLKNGAYMPYIVNVKSEFLIQTFFVWNHKTFNSEQKLGSF